MKKTNKFYGTSAWQRCRKQHKINNPLCKMCSDRGVTRLGIYIDHIIPININYDLRLDSTNLQNLCAKCHSHKTNQIDKQLLNSKEPKPLRGIDTDGVPVDKLHHWNNND